MAAPTTYGPSKIITAMFAIESVFNVVGGGAMVAAPKYILSLLARDQSFVTPLAELLIQLAGGLVVSFTAPLTLGLRAGPKEKRIAYQFLAAGEMVLIPVLVGKWLNKSDAGLTDNSELLIMAGNLLPFLIWRIWCLGWRPEWFGQEQGQVALE